MDPKIYDLLAFRRHLLPDALQYCQDLVDQSETTNAELNH